jgi:hypothetical protein
MPKLQAMLKVLCKPETLAAQVFLQIVEMGLT